tara:strand:+ start:99 stop:1016 length:918 start_codon:yes stop_codon:yes gene_type:complete
MTIAIAYTGGAYGTYLEWVLTTLTTELAIVPPFRETGSSHNFSSKPLRSIHESPWEVYTKNPKQFLFVRLHPKILSTDVLSDNLETILNFSDKLLYVYPDRDFVLATINNIYEKLTSNTSNENWWDHRKRADIDFINKMYHGWDIDSTLPLVDVPNWIKREYLSYNLMPSWFNEVEWYHADEWQHDRSKTILIKDLLFDFEKTILDIQQFCKLDFKKNIAEMIPHHHTMLSLQKNINQDQLCSDIIRTTINDISFDWSNKHLPLPSQAWIQWQLRNLGYEMRCVGIDIFPSNSVQLKKLLYTANE